jgi:hypothetical protein
MPANNKTIAGTKNFCPGTRMARSYRVWCFTSYVFKQ